MKKNKQLLAMSLALVMTSGAMLTGFAAEKPVVIKTGTQTTASAEPAQKEQAAVPAMSTKTPNGSDYCWQPQGIYFKANADRVMLDYFAYQLNKPMVTNEQGVMFITLQDLKTLYAPDFTVSQNGTALTISHAGVTSTITLGSTAISGYTNGQLAAAPYEADGEIYVPVLDLMSKGFGKLLKEESGYYGLGNNADFKLEKADTYNLKMFFRGKNVGKSYWAYWNEDVNRLESVVVYIPSTYNAAKPNKMIVQLHGASGNATAIPDSDNGLAMMEEAEKYGYVVMWPEAYGKQCNFGMWVQPAGQLPITAETDPKNPGGYSEKKLKDIELSGRNVQKAMDFVESKWNIDQKNVFLMGISMGACGTWYQAATYANRFSACSPSGAFVEPNFFDWSAITIPTLYVGGTEDRNGFDLMLNAYAIAKSQGANIVDFITVGGAPHGGEWPKVLDETYEFFERYLK